MIQSTTTSKQNQALSSDSTESLPGTTRDQDAKSMHRGICRTATDNELIMRYSIHNDGRCFEELFRRHSNLVLQVCRSILGNYSDADDAFQATFLVLVRKADRLFHVTSLSAWLYKVAFRIAVKANQDRSRKPAGELQSEISIESDQLDHISQKELMTVVFHELNQLPTRYQQVLIECYLQGKSYRQVAESLDHSEAAVKGLIARAKKLLRNRLLQRGVALTFALAILAKVKSATAAELATGASPIFHEIICLSANSSSHSVSSSIQSLSQFGGPSMGSHVFLKSSIALGIIIAFVFAAISNGNSSHSTAQGSDSGFYLLAKEPEPNRTKVAIGKQTVEPESAQVTTSTLPDDKEKIIHRVIRLQFVTSEKAAEIVTMLFETVRANSDARSNSIITTGSVADLEKVMALLKSIDVPSIATSNDKTKKQSRDDDQQVLLIEYELAELDLRRQATKLKIEALLAESRAIRKQADRNKALADRQVARPQDPDLEMAQSLAKESEALFAKADLIGIEKQIDMLKRKLPKKVKSSMPDQEKPSARESNINKPAKTKSK